MNQLSNDRSLSRCDRKIAAAKKERSFYWEAYGNHWLSSCQVEDFLRQFERVGKLAVESAKLSGGNLLTNSCWSVPGWIKGYGRPSSTQLIKLLFCERWTDVFKGQNKWHQVHMAASLKCEAFYAEKIKYLEAKKMMLNVHADYEQQPVA